MILAINYNQFVKSVNAGTKKIIKLLIPDLFSEHGNKTKDLIFICLDSFQDEGYKTKQFIGFMEMICK